MAGQNPEKNEQLSFGIFGDKPAIRHRPRNARELRREQSKPPLEWSDHVEKTAENSGRYWAHKFGLRGEDRIDFARDAIEHILVKVKAKKLRGIAGIDQAVKRFAIDKIPRLQSRRIQPVTIDSEELDRVVAANDSSEVIETLSFELEDVLNDVLEWSPQFLHVAQRLRDGASIEDIAHELDVEPEVLETRLKEWQEEAKKRFDVSRF